MVEENSRLSRAIGAVLLAGALGCTLNRTGLTDLGGPPGGNDAGSDRLAGDRPMGAAGAGGGTGMGGDSGTGGDGGGGSAGGGTGGSAGGSGDAGANIDAGPDLGPTDVPVDQGGSQGGPDAGVCGASLLCDTRAVSVTLPGGRFTGTTSGASVDRGSCGGGSAPEAVFKLILTEKSDVFITTHGTGFDTVVYMRDGCCGAEIGCNDDADGRTTSVLTERGLAAGTYDIFVDGASSGPMGVGGAFTLDIYATPTTATPGDNCGSAARIANLPVNGTTCGLANDFEPMAGCLIPPATTGEDAVYYFVLDAPTTTVLFSTCTNTCFDDALFIRDVCTMPASQRLCNDNFCRGVTCAVGAPMQSRVTGALGPGVHYLVLDTHLSAPTAACGSYTISSTGIPP